ncbi:MAG: hypothetical protein LAP40_26385 [Acidobacteriia bacterium]|nr:hypothetical protein [Terriglobia bacterium]
MSEGAPNPQINVSKIPGSAGIAGAMFAFGGMLIFLIGIPRFRYFLLAALVVGGGIALVLRFIRRETPGKPWILSPAPGAKGRARRDSLRRPWQFRQIPNVVR